jgi:type IV secretory system conjugative DNA transfer VirD4/TraG family protein/type IV secretion system coupling TraD/TrwB family protein
MSTPIAAAGRGLPVGELFAWVADRPWLAGLALAAVAGWVSVRNLLGSWRHRRLVDGARLVTIAPQPQVEPAGAAALWTTLLGVLTPSTWRRRLYGIPHVGFEYLWSGRALTIRLWVPGTIPPGAVEAAVYAAWPGAACTTSPAAPPIPPGATAAAAATGGALIPALADTLPLGVDHDTDPLRPLIAAGAQISDREHACVQILARPATAGRARKARTGAARLRRHEGGDPLSRTIGNLARAAIEPVLWVIGVFLPGPEPRTTTATVASRGTAAGRADPVRDRDARATLDKTHPGPLWEVAIRYAVATNPTTAPVRRGRRGRHRVERRTADRLRGLAHTIASSFAAHTGHNKLHRLRLPRPVETLAGRRLGRGFLLGIDELRWLAGLPTDVAVPGLDRARAKAAPAPVAVPAGGRGTRVLGRAEIGGHSVALSAADARHHIHLVGKTGVGKSTLLLNLVLSDVHAGRGAVVIDPRGDLIEDILDRIPARLADAGRVVLIDPKQDHPASFNPLEGADPHLAVDNLVSVFTKIFARAWGPRMEDTLRVACLTLMQHANPTLSAVSSLLYDKQFRAQFTAELDDPEGLHGYWQWYDSMNEPMRAQVIGPVLARLRALLLRDFVKRVIGGPASTFDMGKVLDGQLLLCRLPKGVLGEDTVKVLGSLIVGRVWQAATARAATPEPTRRDASLYVDECQNFLNIPGSVADMLAEARGYRLSIVLAHQDLLQLPREIAAAASANARNKIYFTVDPNDAKQLSAHTLPELDEHDLAHLDRYTAAARLVVDGRETPAFTVKTHQPPPVVGEATAIRQACAAATGTPQPSPIDTLARNLARRREHDKQQRRRDRRSNRTAPQRTRTGDDHAS